MGAANLANLRQALAKSDALSNRIKFGKNTVSLELISLDATVPNPIPLGIGKIPIIWLVWHN